MRTLHFDCFQYGHDRNGNRLYRENLLDATFSELYHANGAGQGYDLFDQLTAFARGTLNAAKDSVTGTPSRNQGWNLDALGNWTTLTSTMGGGAPTVEDRTHNAQNQITEIEGTPLTFDSNGNLVIDDQNDTFLFDNHSAGIDNISGGSTTGPRADFPCACSGSM